MHESTNYATDKIFENDEKTIKVTTEADNIEKYAKSMKLTREAKR